MPTYKRIDGDYSIVTVNSGDSITFDTSTANITGNLLVSGGFNAGNVTIANVSAANVTMETLVVSATISAGANINAPFFVGDGQFLSNVIANVGGASILLNGSSNVAVPAANSNVVVSVQGINPITTFHTDGVDIVGNVSVSQGLSVPRMTTNDISSDDSAFVTVSDGLTVDGALDVRDDLVMGGNIIAGGAVTAVGNITGDFIFGNGALLTGVITSVANINFGNTDMTIVGSGGNIVANISGTQILDINPLGLSVAGKISGLTNPTIASDAATKEYVDTAVSTGINIHDPVKVKTTGNLTAVYTEGGTAVTITDIASGNTLTAASDPGVAVNDVVVFYSTSNGITANTAYFVFSTSAGNNFSLSSSYNGTEITDFVDGTGLSISGRSNSGLGATLTNAGANAALVIDSVTANVSDRVLVASQANAATNGIYTVTVTGDAGNAWVLTRATDNDTYVPGDTTGMNAGDYVFVSEGVEASGDSFVMTAPTGVVRIGIDNITWTQFNQATTYTAGTGLTLTGTTFSVNPSQPQITTVGTLGSLSATGNISGAGLTLTGDITSGNFFAQSGTVGLKSIININGNGIGNIGNATGYFNTVFAKATSAQYADLAELYLADADYDMGTVLSFGGSQEVTQCLEPASHRVAGVVSDKPAHIMNAGLQGAHVTQLALIGRVQCKVHAPVEPGDLLVSAGNGWAKADNQAAAGRIIGKSLVHSQQDALIEIVVGKH